MAVKLVTIKAATTTKAVITTKTAIIATIAPKIKTVETIVVRAINATIEETTKAAIAFKTAISINKTAGKKQANSKPTKVHLIEQIGRAHV